MATVKDLTLLYSTIIKQALGENALATVDVTDVGALKREFNSLSDDSKDLVFKTLIDRIGMTIIDAEEYTGRFKWIFKSAFEYGCVLQKVHVGLLTAKKSGVYDNLEEGDVDTDLYKVFLPDIAQKLFEDCEPWEFAVTIFEKQMKSGFPNAESLYAWVNGIYTAMNTSIEKYLETAGRTMYAKFISEKLNTTADGIHAVNVLQAYYDETGEDVTDIWKYDADFLCWLTSEFMDKKDLLGELTVLFNTDGYERSTSADSLKFVCIKKVIDNINRFALSDNFNKSLVDTPAYEGITYWQGLGTSASLDDRLTIKVKVKNPEYNPDDEESEAPEYITTDKKVIAVMHDDDCFGATIYDRDTVVVENRHGKRRNLFEQGEFGAFMDTGENAIVFYIDTVDTGDDEDDNVQG